MPVLYPSFRPCTEYIAAAASMREPQEWPRSWGAGPGEGTRRFGGNAVDTFDARMSLPAALADGARTYFAAEARASVWAGADAGGGLLDLRGPPIAAAVAAAAAAASAADAAAIQCSPNSRSADGELRDGLGGGRPTLAALRDILALPSWQPGWHSAARRCAARRCGTVSAHARPRGLPTRRREASRAPSKSPRVAAAAAAFAAVRAAARAGDVVQLLRGAPNPRPTRKRSSGPSAARSPPHGARDATVRCSLLAPPQARPPPPPPPSFRPHSLSPPDRASHPAPHPLSARPTRRWTLLSPRVIVMAMAMPRAAREARQTGQAPRPRRARGGARRAWRRGRRRGVRRVSGGASRRATPRRLGAQTSLRAASAATRRMRRRGPRDTRPHLIDMPHARGGG